MQEEAWRGVKGEGRVGSGVDDGGNVEIYVVIAGDIFLLLPSSSSSFPLLLPHRDRHRREAALRGGRERERRERERREREREAGDVKFMNSTNHVCAF